MRLQSLRGEGLALPKARRWLAAGRTGPAHRRRIALDIAWLVALALLVPKATHAYIDPGSGSTAFQLVLAAFVGASFFVRRLVARFVAKFRSAEPRETAVRRRSESSVR